MTVPGKTQKLLVIVGPTASGKSALAVRLARKFKGEIVSADSRQVYRGLDIGTVKVPGKWERGKSQIAKSKSSRANPYSNIPRNIGIRNGAKYFVYKGVRHHLIDFVSPKRRYTAAEYAAAGRKILDKLCTLGRLPIICGGTGHYIAALLGEQVIPDVPPDPKLRARLEKLSTHELFAQLTGLDPRRAKTIDRHNPRRLIRALEIVLKTGKPVPCDTEKNKSYSNVLENIGIENMEVLKIGLRVSPAELRWRINARLAKDLKHGLVAEVKKLHANGLSWKRLDELGLQYHYVAKFLHGEIVTKKELEQKLQTELWRYAKRQMTWFKKDKNITWARSDKAAVEAVKKFLLKSARGKADATAFPSQTHSIVQ